MSLHQINPNQNTIPQENNSHIVQSQPVRLPPQTSGYIPRPKSERVKLKTNHVEVLGFFVFVILFVAIGATAYLFLRLNTDKNVGPTVTGQGSGETGNTIDLGGEDDKEYKYAAITFEDVITLFTETGEELEINLNRQEWKNLKWSPENKFLSALGKEEGSENFDLNIYTKDGKKWELITNYFNTNIGVSNYIWQSEQAIYFNQGLQNDNWLHRFIYPTVAEIFKLSRIDGVIENLSPNKDLLLYKMNNGGFKVYNLLGEEQWDLTSLMQSLRGTKVLFSGDQSRVLILGQNSSKLYKVAYQGTTSEEVILQDFIPVCSVNADNFIGYIYDSFTGDFNVTNLNIKDGTEAIIATKNLANAVVYPETIECIGINSLLLKTFDAEAKEQWFKISPEGFLELPYLDGSKEVESINY